MPSSSTTGSPITPTSARPRLAARASSFSTPGSVRVAHTTSVRSDDNFGLYDTEAATIAYDKGEESTFFDGIFVDSESTNNQITHGHFLDNADLRLRGHVDRRGHRRHGELLDK